METLTSDEAEEIAKEKLKLLFNKDFTVSNAGFGERSSGISSNTIKTWDFSSNMNSSSDNNDGQICINASNGELVDIYRYNSFSNDTDERFEPKITPEEAYDKAIQIISKLYPEKIKEIKTAQRILNFSNSYTQSNLGFNFQRLVNGLTYKYDGINFNFSTKTGELLNLNCNWESSITTPMTSNIINEGDAKKYFFQTIYQNLCIC